MRRILLAPVLALTLVFGGCAQLRDAATVVTTTIVNPIDSVDVYRAKNVYAATLQAAVSWRELCWSKPYDFIVGNAEKGIPADPILKPICKNRRPWLRQIQEAKNKASMAVHDATLFVEMHPTLNAAVVVKAAWDAVTKFRNAIPAKN